MNRTIQIVFVRRSLARSSLVVPLLWTMLVPRPTQASNPEVPSSAADPVVVATELSDLPPPKVDAHVTQVSAGSPAIALTLEGAIERALEQNPGLEAVEEDIRAARWRYYQERARYAPQFSWSRSYTSQTQPPSLGSFRVGSGEVHTRRLQIDQPIYTFGRQSNGIKQRRHETEAARSTYRNARHDLVLQVKELFYSILLQTELIQNARDSLQELKTQHDQSIVRYEAGAATQFDVLLARSQLANARPPLIRALHDLEIANQGLITLLGIDGLRRVEVTGEFVPVAPTLTFEAALQQAVARRQDLKSLVEQRASIRRRIKALRATHYPTLSGTAAHDVTQGQRFPVDQDVEINSVTFSLSVPFYDGGQSHAQVREAQAALRKVDQQIRQTRISIRNEVVQAFLTIEGAAELIDAAREGLLSATKALSDANIGYEAGVRTSLEVLDAQTKLTTARTNLARAQHDYSVARARFARVVASE